MFVDTHAHLDFTDNPQAWIDGAKENNVSKIICVGTSVEASKKCVDIAEKYSESIRSRNKFGMTKGGDLQIFASVGIHAQDGREDVEKFGSLGKCIEILNQVQNDSKKVVAVGECGFDFKLGNRVKRIELSEKEQKFQKELFEAQIRLAVELNLPILIHCRNAWVETFEVLSGQSPELTQQGTALNLKGLFHSWTGSWDDAQRALKLGFYISFSGIVTFKNAPVIQDVAKRVPLERMLLETDSPFLAPEPMRGSPNEPKNVKIVAQFIAKLRNLPVDEVASVTSNNAGRLFGI